jgi:hypothetical protein
MRQLLQTTHNCIGMTNWDLFHMIKNIPVACNVKCIDDSKKVFFRACS